MTNLAFDVDKFFDKLSSDITEIHVNHKKITYLPDLSRFTRLKVLYQ